MRTSHISMTLLLAFGFAFVALADDKPKLIDEKRALQDLRPLDRHTWVLTLEGEWGVAGNEKLRPAEDKAYFVNIFFPDGGIYSHRVVGQPVFSRGAEKYQDYTERLERHQAVADPMFLKGEVRCMVPDYQLARHGLAKGGKLTIAVSADRAADSLDSDKLITAPIEIFWPPDRPIQPDPVHTRHSRPEAPDAFPGGR
jgi:hypothetical protein